jgi:hypothetical protein
MSVTTTKFIRKPLYVDAVRITRENFNDVAAWCQGEIQRDEIPGKGTSKPYIRIRVHNPKNPRQTKAFVGDWLLYTERGYKVYTKKAFHASFDDVPIQDEADITVIGPECFAAADGSVLSWKGVNYVPQEHQTISGGEPDEVVIGGEANEALEAAREGVALEEQLGEGLQGPSPESDGAEDDASGQDEKKAA